MNADPAPLPPASALILIADDHQEIRDLLGMVLELHPGMPSFQVVGRAADGLEAVEIARIYKPHAAVLDLSMPRMDGLEAARLLRQENPSMIIVIYSGFESAQFAEKARECGADAYVEKGSEGLDEVINQLERLLKSMKSE